MFPKATLPCPRNASCAGVRGFTRSMCCSKSFLGEGVPAGTGPAVPQGWLCCSVILLSSSSGRCHLPAHRHAIKPRVKTAGGFSSTSLHETSLQDVFSFAFAAWKMLYSSSLSQAVTVEPLNLQMLKAFILTAMSLIDPQCQYIKPSITLLLCSKLRAAACSLSIETTEVKPATSRCDFTFKGVQGSVCPCSQCCCQQLVKQHKSLLFFLFPPLFCSSALLVAQKYCTLI